MKNEHSQGFGVYEARTGEEVCLAMQDLHLTGEILPVGARLVVRHCFQSGEAKPLEAVYAFALPRDAALRGFRIAGDGFDTRSELKAKEVARTTYEEGLEAGHLSSVAQTYKDGLVNLTVGNIRPGETVAVYLEIASGVSCTDDGFRFRFPFTLAPRYHAQASACTVVPGVGELALPESSFDDLILPRWHDDAEHLHRVGFDLSLALPTEDAEIASPSHTIAVRMTPEANTRVRLAQAEDLPDRDLILDVRYALSQVRIYTGTDGCGKGRFAALVPSHCFGKPKEMPKNVIFLVDRSGSMGGRPFNQAKQATMACIAALGPKDRFGVVFFESTPTAFSGGCGRADQQHRDGACTFINDMPLGRSTELSQGVAEAARLLPEGGDILLVTDGQVAETGTIITCARETGIRVHCLGIGSASQDRFLALLARSTGGTSYFASPRERVDEAALRVFSAVGNQVAEGIRCEIEGLSEAVLAPVPVARVHHGEPLLLFGVCNGPGEGSVRCCWNGGELVLPLVVNKTQPADSDNEETVCYLGETLKLVQGARIITDLEGEAADSPETPQAARRIEKRRQKRWQELADEYGLANPAMALVAVVKRAGDQPGDLPVTRVMPVGMPRDTSFGAYFDAYDTMWIPAYIRGRSSNKTVGVVCEARPNIDRESSYNEKVLDAYLRESYTAISESGKRDGKPSKPLPKEESEAIMDAMMKVLTTLEADGGLPGRDMEGRVARTLVALMALHGVKRQYAGTYFNAHIRRITEFLRAHETIPGTPEKMGLLSKTLDNHEGTKLVDEQVIIALQLLKKDAPTHALWKWIMKQHASVA